MKMRRLVFLALCALPIGAAGSLRGAVPEGAPAAPAKPAAPATPATPAESQSPARTLEAGDPAPDFALAGSDGKTYRLSEFKGKRAVVVAWFPKAFTGG